MGSESGCRTSPEVQIPLWGSAKENEIMHPELFSEIGRLVEVGFGYFHMISGAGRRRQGFHCPS
jgi:hypothetical protein